MRKQDETAARMLHELREPVQAIRGFLSIVLADRVGSLTEVQRDFLSSANRAALRLERLILDFDVLGAHAENLSLIPEQIDLLSNVKACIAELQPMAINLGVDVRFEMRSPDDLEILADPDRIDQILLNLLENGLRYGDPSEPVRIRLRGGRTKVLCVIENGILALTEHQDLDEWFLPHTRRAGDREQAYAQGRGLGLCIVQTLVHAHHGRVLTRITRKRVSVGFVLPRNLPHLMSLPGQGLAR